MSLLRSALALTCVLVVVGSAQLGLAQDSARKALPRLGDPAAAEEVTGRIADSTRGKPGPVRLVLTIAGGRELAALVAPDKVCETLGLSLEAGEDVTLVGRMITTGERPLLVTEAVVVDGRRIEVRDSKGGWVKPLEPKSDPAPKAEPEAGAPAES